MVSHRNTWRFSRKYANFVKDNVIPEEYNLYTKELYQTLIRRNTKESAGIVLPQIKEENEFLDFTPDERTIYETAFDCRRRRIHRALSASIRTFQKYCGAKPISIEEVRQKMKLTIHRINQG